MIIIIIIIIIIIYCNNNNNNNNNNVKFNHYFSKASFNLSSFVIDATLSLRKLTEISVETANTVQRK